MKHIDPTDPRTPPYCLVPQPYHFQVRTDLLEEFCLIDAYRRFLPRNEDAHRRWLSCVGRTADEAPLEYVSCFTRKPYRQTPRYILAAEIVAGTRYRTNLAIDGNGLPQILPHRGLFHFVIERAVHVCVLKGMSEGQTRLRFLPALPTSFQKGRIESDWAIGLDHMSGYCTILVRGSENEARFLAARGAWSTPFSEG